MIAEDKGSASVAWSLPAALTAPGDLSLCASADLPDFPGDHALSIPTSADSLPLPASKLEREGRG